MQRTLTDGQPSPLVLPAGAGVFLDFDGTLVDFAPRPEAVVLAHGTLDLLESLRGRCAGALAIVTGRALPSLDALIAPLELAAAGMHGAQFRRTPGGEAPVRPMPRHAELVERLNAFARQDPGLLVEDKGASVALHYRLAPALGAGCLEYVRTQGRVLGLEVIAGHCVVEARAPGVNKGRAVEEFLSQPPFAGRLPVFVGDDTTDEDGFSVVNRLDGISVKVGSGPSGARYRLESVTAVHQWLRRAVESGTNPVVDHGRLQCSDADGSLG